MFDGEASGLTLSAVMERSKDDARTMQFMNTTWEIFTSCLEACQPVLNGPRQLTMGLKGHLRYESLTVPFLNDKGEVTQLGLAVNLLLVET